MSARASAGPRPRGARSSKDGLVAAYAPLLSCALALLLSGPQNGAEAEEGPELFSEDGFRLAELRSPVPETLAGARTLSTLEVKELADRGGAAFLDVLPAPARPKSLPATSLWLPPQRRNIPGSLWLPNVGYGRLSQELEAYFRRGLELASGGDREKEIVVYCLDSCWMSWNAARRAAGYGYLRIYWYPEGTDGWAAAGLPLEKSDPMPLDLSEYPHAQQIRRADRAPGSGEGVP